MNYKKFLVASLSVVALFSQDVFSQSNKKKEIEIKPTRTEVAEKKEIISGPFVSYIDGYSTRFWMLVPKGTKEVKLRLEDFDQRRDYEVKYKVGDKGDYQRNFYKSRWNKVSSEYLKGDEVPVTIDVQNLDKDKEYNVSVYLDNYLAKEEFTLYMERAHPTDVYFLFGGNLNNTKQTSIFSKMEKIPNDFMVWGGNNFGKSASYDFKAYTDHCKEVRKDESLNAFMQSTPQIATWGANDYSPEAYGKNYINKDSALLAFNMLWPNLPKKVYNYTFNNYGTYGKYDYNDVDIFMLDDQTFRNDEKQDVKFGDKQIERFLRDLSSSNASFKIIISNSSFFGEESEAAKNYEKEFSLLMRRIRSGNHSGLFFMSLNNNGNSTLNTLEREKDYDLSELSLGALTGNNGTFARVRVEGKQNLRKLFIDLYNSNGKLLETKSILETDLKN